MIGSVFFLSGESKLSVMRCGVVRVWPVDRDPNEEPRYSPLLQLRVDSLFSQREVAAASGIPGKRIHAIEHREGEPVTEYEEAAIRAAISSLLWCRKNGNPLPGS